MTATSQRVDPRAIAGLTALVALPLAVALVALRQPTWVPLFDLTMTEFKVRDVGSSDPPLVGLAGRIGTPGQPGSHPGPVAYWLLWPVYRLLGQTSWALQASSAVFHTAAIAVALWIAGRRGGLRLAVGGAAVLAAILAAFGAVLFTVPWNPHLPVLWWLVFLLAGWSVLTGDLPMLPVAVFAGSIVAQTHVPYLALTISTTGVLAIVALASAIRRKRVAGRPASPPTSVRWLAVSATLGVVLWLPPLIEQATANPGNIRQLVDHFGTPNADPIGLAEGARVVVERLNPIALLTLDVDVDGYTPSSALLPGLALLASWVVATSIAWTRRHSTLLALDVVAGSAVVLGVLAASRIFGGVWNYLLLWAWIAGALVIVATAWGLSLALPVEARARLSPHATPALLLCAVAWTLVGSVGAIDAEVSDQMRSTQTDEVASQTADALADRRDTDRFLVEWRDPTHLGTQGWGLILELERRGFDVYGSTGLSEMLGGHRVAAPDEVDAVLVLAVGPAIGELRADPSAVELAYTDHGRARRDARTALIDEVVETLLEQGEDELAATVRRRPADTQSDPAMPARLARSLAEASDIGYPVAVFLVEDRS